MKFAEFMQLEESLKKAGWRQDRKLPAPFRSSSRETNYSCLTKKISAVKVYVVFTSYSFSTDAYLLIPAALQSTPDNDLPGYLRLTPDDHVPTVSEIEEEAKTRIAHHLLHHKKRVTKIPKEVIDEATEIAFELVTSAYENWRSSPRDFYGRSLRKEPSITVGDVAEELGQYSAIYRHSALAGVDKSKHSRWLTQLASNALGRLVRNGKLRTSTGIGRTGKETRCYEPA